MRSASHQCFQLLRSCYRHTSYGVRASAMYHYSINAGINIYGSPSFAVSQGSGCLRKAYAQSPKTIAAAKKVLPPFGELYGHFSKNFTHIGHLHKSITPVTEFHEKHDALVVNLDSLRIAAWLLYVTTELLFNEFVPEPRYWYPVKNGYVYNPASKERDWMSVFFRSQNTAES
jgi:hypothetical protein